MKKPSTPHLRNHNDIEGTRKKLDEYLQCLNHPYMQEILHARREYKNMHALATSLSVALQQAGVQAPSVPPYAKKLGSSEDEEAERGRSGIKNKY